MTTPIDDPLRQLAARQRERRVEAGRRRVRFHITDAAGRVVATASAQREAVALVRSQPELTLRRSQEDVPGAPRAREVLQAIQATEGQRAEFQQALDAVAAFTNEAGEIDVVAALEGGISEDTLAVLVNRDVITRARGTQEALQLVAPFRDEEGNIDVVGALEAGIDPAILERLFTTETIEASQLTVEQLAEIEPFRTDDGVDLVAALEGGVSEETLQALFPSEAVVSAQTIQTARAELDDRTPVQFIQQGGDPQFLRDLGIDDSIVDALVAVQEFVDEDGRINVSAALEAGIPRPTLETLGVTQFPTPPRDFRAELNQAIEPLPVGIRADLFGVLNNLDAALVSSAGQPVDGLDIQQQINQAARRISDTANDLMTTVMAQRARLADFEARAQQQIRIAQRNLARPGGDTESNRELLADGERRLAEVRAHIQQWNAEVFPKIRDEFERAQARAIEVFSNAARGVEPGPPGPVIEILDPDTGEVINVTSNPVVVFEAEEAGFETRPLEVPEAPDVEGPEQRFEIIDPESMERVGFASGQEAIDVALEQGFEVVEVGREELDLEPVSPDTEIKEEGFDEEELLEPEPVSEEEFEQFQLAIETLQERGLAQETEDGFEIDVARASSLGLSEELLVLGFTEEEIGRDRSFQRLQRQAFDPGQQMAISQLEMRGLTDNQGGVFISDAIAQGQRGLLLQAGFTSSQIEEALSEQRAIERTGRQLQGFTERRADVDALTERVNQIRQLEALQQRIDFQLGETEAAIANLTPRQREGLDPGFAALGTALDQLQEQRAIITRNIETLRANQDLPGATPAFPGLAAPGFRAELPEDIKRLRDQLNLQSTVSTIGERVTLTGKIAALNPFEASRARQTDLVNAYAEAIEQGALTQEQGQQFINEIPENVTNDDWVQARIRLGNFLTREGGAVPAAGLVFAGAGLGLRWDQLTPTQRKVEAGLLGLYAIGTAGAAVRGARASAGALGGVARGRVIAKSVAEQEMAFIDGLVTRPAQTVTDAVRLGVINPLEAGVHAIRSKAPLPVTRGPQLRLMGLEDNVQTMRVAARERFAHDIGAVDMPEGLWKLVDAGEVTPQAIQRATAETTLGVMRTGQRTPTFIKRADGTNTPFQVDIRPSSLHDVSGRGFAFSGTPDGRIGMLPEGITVNEGMLWFSTNPHSRFTLSTSSTRPIQWTPEQLNRFNQLGLDKPVPTVYVFSGDDLLNQLEAAARLNGKNVPASTPGATPKLHGGRAESEAVAREGVETGPAVQRFFRRDNAGNRVQVLVYGEPLTSAEVRALNIRATYAAGRTVASPAIRWNYTGTDKAIAAEVRQLGRGRQLGDDFSRLDDYAREYGEASARLRNAGYLDDALDAAYEGALARRAIPIAYPVGGTYGVASSIGERGGPDLSVQSLGDVASVVRDRPTEQITGVSRIATPLPVEAEVGRLDGDMGDRATVFEPTIRGDRDLGDITSSRLNRLDQLRQISITRELSNDERLEARQIINFTSRAELPPRDQTTFDSLVRTPAFQPIPRIPVVPPPRGTPPRGSVPPPRGTPPRGVVPPPRGVVPPPRGVVPPPRGVVPPPGGIPPPDGVPPPDGPGIPSSDDVDKEFRPELNLRVVGINRGALDTSVDLVTGATETAKEIDGVPERPTRETFVPLAFGEFTPTPQRVRWGALDLILGPGGSFKWVQAGAPLPSNNEMRAEKKLRNGRKLRGRRRRARL